MFHQVERRVKAHLLVAFLGYALWVTLKHLLHRRGTGLTPARALARPATATPGVLHGMWLKRIEAASAIWCLRSMFVFVPKAATSSDTRGLISKPMPPVGFHFFVV